MGSPGFNMTSNLMADFSWSLNAQPEDFSAVFTLLEAQRFPVDQDVSFRVPFEEGPDALRSWTENPSKFKKTVVSSD